MLHVSLPHLIAEECRKSLQLDRELLLTRSGVLFDRFYLPLLKDLFQLQLWLLYLAEVLYYILFNFELG